MTPQPDTRSQARRELDEKIAADILLAPPGPPAGALSAPIETHFRHGVQRLPATKEQAEALRVGLLGWYVTPDEVIAWADEVIVAGGIPGPEIIEVSLGGSKPVVDLHQALTAIPGVASQEVVLALALGQMTAALRRDPAVAGRIVATLYHMLHEGMVPSERMQAEIYGLDHAFDLASSGVYGTTEEAHARLVEFLSEWGSQLPSAT